MQKLLEKQENKVKEINKPLSISEIEKFYLAFLKSKLIYSLDISKFPGKIIKQTKVYKDNIYPLPFNMFTFNKIWGCITPKEAKKIIDKQKKEIKSKPKNLE